VSGDEQLSGGNVKGAIVYARQCMQQELAPELTYHNMTHTFEHVMPAAMELADLCGVSPEEKDLLAVAVAFHDLGWIVQGRGHEQLGAEMARRQLPAFGFNDQQIDSIVSMILATRMPPRSTCLLDSIIIDADMAILSRDDFRSCNNQLRMEIEALGEPLSDRQWYESQLAFLEQHRYFTDVAAAHYEPIKQQHILELRHSLDDCTPGPASSRNGRSSARSQVKSGADG
jgi:uncharacterized protein